MFDWSHDTNLTTPIIITGPLFFVFFFRLDMWDINPNPFDWSHDINDDHHIHVQDIPPIHQAVLNLIGQWMETFPSDFRNNPELQVNRKLPTLLLLPF